MLIFIDLVVAMNNSRTSAIQHFSNSKNKFKPSFKMPRMFVPLKKMYGIGITSNAVNEFLNSNTRFNQRYNYVFKSWKVISFNMNSFFFHFFHSLIFFMFIIRTSLKCMGWGGPKLICQSG